MKCSGVTQKGNPCTRNAVDAGRCKLHPVRDIKWTMTLTFGDVAENHVGMEKIGGKAKEGFTLRELQLAQTQFSTLGCACEMVDLSRPGTEPAYILVIRNALGKLLREHEPLFAGQLLALNWDTKALSRGRVVNKKARHNLCFSDHGSEPDYEKGKGRVIAFKDLVLLNYIRECLPCLIGESGRGLQAEGNLYYDVENCGIGYHGDAERMKVIALRLGEPMSLHYQWFQDSKPIHDNVKLILGHGDMYIMSAKAVGTDWRKKKIPTLRHAAGSKEYTTLEK